ncbi:MAG: Fur family transcriptional regulator [Anaerolineaceae bacterium]|nr:Fur family transcriptional regulator [Anaerolineaceae bacterium]
MRTSSVDLVILETLAQKHAHLTSHQLYEQIHDRLPALNPSTVYRALERLANDGKISVSDMGFGSAVYESVANGIHHHLVCQVCGRVFTIGDDEVRDFFTAVQKKNNFQVITNHLILFGMCDDCQKQKNLIMTNSGS